MRKLTTKNVDKLIKNRSLLKSNEDPTVMYVYSGHPIDDYSGRPLTNRFLMFSLTTSDYLTVRENDLSEGGWYFVEDETDAMKGMQPDEGETYSKFLDRVKKVFG